MYSTPRLQLVSFMSHSALGALDAPAWWCPTVAPERFLDDASRTTAHPTSAPPNLMPRKTENVHHHSSGGHSAPLDSVS